MEGPYCLPSGIDLVDLASDILQPQGDDGARIAWYLRNLISTYQKTFSVIEQVTLGGWRALPVPSSLQPA